MMLSRIPLATLVDSATGHLEEHLRRRKALAAGTDCHTGLIFSGNPHETVPRRLLLDDRLSPLERNAWQVFRLLLNADGITAFPTYEQLQPYLGTRPGKPASRETIAKALTALRLTRWLSLARRVRNDLTGQVRGNVYLLHDEPVSPAEAITMDKDYMQLLGHSLESPNRTIREIAEIAWNEFKADPDVGRRLPTRLSLIEERLTQQPWAQEPLQPIDAPSPEAEFGIRTLHTEPAYPLSSDSELRGNPRRSDLVRIPNALSTYTNTHKDVCKNLVPVPREPLNDSAQWLHVLHHLEPEQKLKALDTLNKIPEEQRPAVVSQWLHRCRTGQVKNPLGYLMSCVQKAIRGEFNTQWTPGASTASPDPAVQATPPPYTPAPAPTPSAETVKTAQQHLSALHQLVKPRMNRDVLSTGEQP
ncbi:hypothetical protein C5U62_32115 [Pseudomonas protegens]|uniref:Helix-turn-helix domain-containing protein n=1 Tax=Pseudomonas protegens TaxID=380021 RepID=A0A2T6GB46_9PSED|nr:STY4528 family pathogenicity island replication protein [Pseudomonas protegens]PUA41372.1 hypothetical protein C5U62_32115 [Pseudomonas protegens]